MSRVGFVVGGLLVGTLLVFGMIPCQAASPQDKALAQQYAPILYFEAGETCYPVNVSFYVPQTKLYGPSGLVDASPTLTSISAYTDPSAGYYLDNQLGTVNDSGIIDAYTAQRATLGYTVYARVTTSGQATVIQYWFFYVFNPGELNRHEGDWEMAQVMIQGGSPTMVGYSQHHNGQKAQWSMVEHDGDHMKDYVARGSHANYLRSFSGKLGVASDYVGDNGLVLQPSGYSIEILENQPWLSFAGNWGWAGGDASASAQASVLGEAGPQGPQYREDGMMWQNPENWGQSLQQAQQPLFIAEWFVYNFVIFFVIITLVVVAILGVVLLRRHRRAGLGPRLFSFLYINGVNAKSIGNILCIFGIILAVLSVFYPWYSVSGVFSSGGQTVTVNNVLVVDAFNGVRVNFPSMQGPVPLGGMVLPFAYIVLIGTMIFLVGTIGIVHTRKLGLNYIWHGIRLLLPFILILLFVLMLGQLSSLVPAGVPEVRVPAQDTLAAISRAPLQGSFSTPISQPAGSMLSVSWQMGWGVYLLLFASVAFFVAGILEVATRDTFYQTRSTLITEKKE